MPTTDTSVPQVIVNKLTKAQYTAATKSPTEFYAVTDEDIYSDFTGATSGAAGAHGLVPAPAAGDQDKFLKGDGTWGTAGGAADATLSFSSTNPIQNQAITNTIYTEGAGQDAGKIAGVNIATPYTEAVANPYMAIGSQSTDTPGEGSVAVGYYATSEGQGSVAIGQYAEGPGLNSVAVGYDAEGNAESSTAVGPEAHIHENADFGTAIGYNAAIDDGATSSTAIGDSAFVDANATEAVALGSGSCAYVSQVVSVGDESINYYRRIVGVADATAAHDAVTKGQLDSATAVMGGATSSVAGAQGLVPAPAAGDQDKYLKGDGTWAAVSGGSGLVEMSYGEANAWAKFIAAYQAGSIVYCRASSNADPSSGSQGRKAFMAYVNNATTPTEVEFQYVRSVSTKTSSQPVDQVFVYKLTSASGGTWTVATRDMGPKLAAGSGASVSYANGTYTISATGGGSGPTVVQTTGQSTTDVMSQKAVTDIIGNVATILQTLNSGNGAQ